MPTRVTVRRDRGLGLLVIAGENKHNTLDQETLFSLYRKLTELSVDNTLTCLIMIGAGTYAFSTGSKIEELAELTPETALKYSALGQGVATLLANLPCPVICCFNGVAYGAGLELALAADFRLATEMANFAFPSAKLGLVPCFGGTHRCPELIGMARTREWFFRGNIIGAQEAKEWGLVNELVPYTELLSTAQEWAQELTMKNPFALQQMKKTLIRQADWEREQKLFANCFRQKGIRQKIMAWAEPDDSLESRQFS